MTQRRVQRTKTEPLPDGCVYVGRPTKWGNPFRVERRDGKWCVVDEDDVDYPVPGSTEYAAQERAVDLHRWLFETGIADLSIDDVVRELSGWDLACWCPLTDPAGRPYPCHADNYLRWIEEANRE